MANQEQSLNNIFALFQTFVDDDQVIRENIRETTKELEKVSRQLLSHMQDINKTNADLKKICSSGRTIIEEQIKPLYAILNTKVPEGDYYRYNEQWRMTTSRIASSCSLIHYLENECLADRAYIANMLGLKLSRNEANVYLDWEDYLVGLLNMASDLSRFTINSVTNGDYARPGKIGRLLTQLDSGFRELNLKNDFLRKRYDSLKYETKKVEEVIYDVSIRGLVRPIEEEAKSPQEVEMQHN